MPNARMKHRRVVHKSTAGIPKPIPEAVDLVENPPPGLTTDTVAPLRQSEFEPPVPIRTVVPANVPGSPTYSAAIGARGPERICYNSMDP